MSILDPEYEKALELWMEFGHKAPGLPPEICVEIQKDFYKWVVTHVINRAVLDLDPRLRGIIRKEDQNSAHEFLTSDVCRLFCNDLGVSYTTLLEKVKGLGYAQDEDHGIT